jgi:hypothetical protein
MLFDLERGFLGEMKNAGGSYCRGFSLQMAEKSFKRNRRHRRRWRNAYFLMIGRSDQVVAFHVAVMLDDMIRNLPGPPRLFGFGAHDAPIITP